MSANFSQLFALILSQGDSARLQDAVTRARDKMHEAGEADLWNFWQGQALLLKGDFDGASEIVSKIEDRERAKVIESQVKQARGLKEGNLGPWIQDLETRYSESGEAAHLLELCEAYYADRRWESISKLALILVDSLKTSSALRLAVEAAQRSEDSALCVNLLDGREQLFPDAKYPLDIKRARVAALCKQGKPKLALGEAEEIAKQSGLSGDIMLLIQVLLECGDPKAAIVAARPLLDRDDLSAESYLRLAYSFQIEDREAAVAYLERALLKGSDSAQFLAGATDLVFKLNREDKFAALRPSLALAAGDGKAIQIASADKIVEVMRERAEAQADVEKLYNRGEIPLHLAVEQWGAPMAPQFHSRFQPRTNIPWPATLPLFIRHGGRASAQGALSITRLYADITSLLLAAQLDILDQVEATLGPIWIPHCAIVTFYQQIDKAQHGQPTVVEAARVVLELVNLGIVKPIAYSGSYEPDQIASRPTSRWIAMNGAARAANGALVDHTPITIGLQQKAADLTTEEIAVVAGIGDLFSSLMHAAALSTGQVQAARERLGPGIDQSSRILNAGTPIILAGNIADVLAGAGLLPAVAAFFQVSIEHETKLRAAAVVESERTAATLKEGLRKLLSRIQQGLEKTWKILPAPRLTTEESGQAEAKYLSELMATVSVVEGAYIWVDDRYINAFRDCAGVPIVTILDVLQELRARGAIEEDGYYSRIHKLREANLRYLPLGADDLLYHLRKAPVRGDELIETPELATLRQYTAACFADRKKLQIPPVAEQVPNKSGEVALMSRLLEATREAFSGIWSNVTSDNIAEVHARADWLLHGIWCDASALAWVADQRANAPAELFGGALAQLYVYGLGLKGARRSGPLRGTPPRELYFSWLQSRLAHDSESVEAAAKHLREVFSKESPIVAKVDERVANVLYGDFLHDLPPAIYQALRLPKSSLERFGIHLIDALNVEGLSFDGSEFWRALERAMRGKPVRIQPNDATIVFVLSVSLKSKRPVVTLAQTGGTKEIRLSDEIFRLLIPDRAQRVSALKQNPQWFDCSRESFEGQIQQIANNPDAADRVMRLERRRLRSAQYYYEKIGQSLAAKSEITLASFRPPALGGLLSHLRLPDGFGENKVSALLERAAPALIADVGWEEAFRRLSALPVRLPAAIISAIKGVQSERRKEWIDSALSECTSPVSRFQLMGVIANFDPARAAALFEKALDSESAKSFDAFTIVLFWVHSQIERHPENARLDSDARLIVTWLHASRLFDLLNSVSSYDFILNFFTDALKPGRNDVFLEAPDFEVDVAHPRNIRFKSFAAHSFAALLGGANYPSETRARITEVLSDALFITAGEQPLPDPGLLLPSGWLNNCADTFLRADLASELAAWIGSKAELLGSAFLSRLLMDPLTRLSESLVATPSDWQLLGIVVGRVRLPAELHEKVVALARDPRLPDVATLEPEIRKYAFYFIAQQISYDSAASPEFEKSLVKVAESFERRKDPVGTLVDDVTLLIECAHTLARAKRQPSEMGRAFSATIVATLEAFPSATREFWNLLRGLTARMSPAIAVGLWPLVFELRRRCKRVD